MQMINVLVKTHAACTWSLMY